LFLTLPTRALTDQQIIFNEKIAPNDALGEIAPS
jgi:hypothetical protein